MKILKRVILILLAILLFLALSILVLVAIYKNDIRKRVVEEVNAQFGADLKVGSVDVSFLDNWPRVSADFRDIELRSKTAPSGSPAVIKAKSLALAFNFRQLLAGNFVVRYVSLTGADVDLRRYADGRTNFEFIKAKRPVNGGEETKSKVRFELKKVHLKECHFLIDNTPRFQHLSFRIKEMDSQMQMFEDGLRAKSYGTAHSDQLAFNTRKGAFAVDKDVNLNIECIWRSDLKTVLITPSSKITIDKQDYAIWLLYDLNGNKQLAFHAEMKNGSFAKAAAVLTPKIQKSLSNFDLQNPLSAKILVVTNTLIKQEPAFFLDFSARQMALSIGQSKVPYNHLNFEGRIVSLDSTHTKGDLRTAKLLISPLNGRVYNFPFTATLSVCNLEDPQISLGAQMQIDGENIEFKVARDFMLQGKVLADLNYSGPTNKLNAKEFLDAPMTLKARVRFRDLSYREFNRNNKYVLNGDANLINKDLQFDGLKLSMVVGDATIKGKADNFLPYILGFSNGFKAKLTASSELLDLNPLFKHPEPLPSAPTQGQKEKKIDLRDAELMPFEFRVQLLATKLLIRKVVATNARADIFYKNNYLDILSLSADACDGKIMARASVSDFSLLKASLVATNMDVHKLFEQFENFGQEAIKAENLSGRISADAKISSYLDQKLEIIPGSMDGDVKVKLTEGHLINFEPLQKMSTLIFKNRDFNDITFSELTETFHLSGQKMEIDELEVASSVLNFFVVDGVYNFHGISNINLLLPWSNLRKRSKNYVPKSSGESASNTRGLRINYRGYNQNMKASFGHQSSEGL
jgi:hypothetical protein